MAKTADIGNTDYGRTCGGGRLRPLSIALATLTCIAWPSGLGMAKQQEYAYLAATGGIRQYRICSNGSLAALTPPKVEGSSASPYSEDNLTVSHQFKVLYAMGGANSLIRPYHIDSGGRLMPHSLRRAPAQDPTLGICDWPSRSLYVIASGTSGLLRYVILPTGALRPAQIMQLPADVGASRLAVDPISRSLYVACYDRRGGRRATEVREFSIRPNGTLLPKRRLPPFDDDGPEGIGADAHSLRSVV